MNDPASDPGVPSACEGGDGRGQPALSAGAVARRLGVAVETLRSWDRRYGLGPAAHQAGAHRRYSPGDVRRLESFCRLLAEGVPSAEAARVVLDTAPPATADGDAHDSGGGDGPAAAAAQTAVERDAPGLARRAGGGNTLPVGRPGTPNARGLARCAIRLDAPGVLNLLDAVIARDGVVPAWEQTIEPALRAVGRKWTEAGGRYVEVEHLLSWCATVALHRVRSRPARQAAGSTPEPTVTTRIALLACAPDEWHSLPLEALAAALTERGVPVRMLGAAVPEAALRSAIARLGPARIVLWSQMSRSGDPRLLARLIGATGPQILPAGPGWSAHRSSGVKVLMSLDEAVEACLRADATVPRSSAWRGG